MSEQPPFVILDGNFDDATWREAAAVPDGQRTPEQQFIYTRGPRPHPYGADAFQAQLTTDQVAVFPSKEAYTKHIGQSQAQSALDQINDGLAKGAAKVS